MPENNFTIEVWATHLSVGRWDQIWYFGTGGQDACLMMYWHRDRDIRTDLVEFRDGLFKDRYNEYDSFAPLLLNTEYHIVLIAEAVGIGGTELRWHVAASSSLRLGDYKQDIHIPYLTPATPGAFRDDRAWLGRAPWTVANEHYNEMRIWNGVLSPDQLEFLHELGPDRLEPCD